MNSGVSSIVDSGSRIKFIDDEDERKRIFNSLPELSSLTGISNANTSPNIINRHDTISNKRVRVVGFKANDQISEAVSVNFDEFSIVGDVYGERGVRKQMEDEHILCASIRAHHPTLRPELDFSVFAIMDGHGGKHSAQFVKANFVDEIAKSLLSHSDDIEIPITDKTIKQVCNAACTRLDSRIAVEIPGCKDGCTVVAVLMKNTHVWIMNIGDSGGVLCRRNEQKLEAIPLTEVHKPWVISEKQRILNSGGTVDGGRVNGSLEVTRSIGDISFKKYGVLCYPTFRKFEINHKKDEFILLGCDGFWNCWAAKTAIDRAHELAMKEMRQLAISRSSGLSEQPRTFDARNLCKKLVEFAIYEKKSQDNVSLLMIRLLPRTTHNSNGVAGYRKA